MQRIQSVYLFIAAVLAVCSMLFPLAYFSGDTGVFNLFALGLKSVDGETIHNTIYLFVLLLASSVLPLVTILLYKKRMLQIRLCVVNMVLMFGSAIMIGVYYFLCNRIICTGDMSSHGLHPAIICPVIAIIFSFLASRGIFKDEVLIRSVDRIR